MQETVITILAISLLVAGCTNPNAMTTTPAPKATSTQTVMTVQATQPMPTFTKQAPISPVASLSASKAKSQLEDLLANNGNCELPCFWNITPGKSSFQEASAILMPFTGISEFSSFKPGLGSVDLVYSTEDRLRIPINISFLSNPDDQIVSSFAFMARTLEKTDNGFTEIFDLPFFKKQLGYYMLPNILTEYGNPTKVMLSTMAKLPSSGVPGGFKLLLLYPEKGILVNYTMQMQIAGKNIRGCPSNAHVELELYPSGHGDSFLNLLKPSGWTQIIQSTYKPLDGATALSQEEFFRIFSQPTNECILTPASLWPVPN